MWHPFAASHAAPNGPSASSDAKPATAPAATLRRAALPTSKTKRNYTRSLTPQFHWNLNDSALQSLSDDERTSLYQVFRFYDSSFQGDALPAIHLGRFLELLRDAQLLASDDSDHGDDELRPQTVERVFAQAVLGKLRTYLDAEEEPALTFQLFSGALFHCAMLKFPDVSPPEQAFRQLVDTLLALQTRVSGGFSSGSRGLVQHAEHAAISSWSVHDLHPDSHAGPKQAFLDRQVFQQVVAGLCHDKFLDEQHRERLQDLYDVPDEITSHFNADTIRYITQRFRTFDVFERGVLPRDELFALLSGMAKKLEITDVYEVLAVILAGEIGDRKQLPRGSLVLSAPSSVKQVSLAQVIQALHVCRRARTASYHASHASPNRKIGGVAAAHSNQTTADTTGGPAAESTTGGAAGKKSNGHHGTGNRKVSPDKRAVKSKTGASAQQHKHASPTKNASKPAHPATAQQQLASPSMTKRNGMAPKKEKKASTVDPGLLRRLSKMSAASSSEASTLHATQDNDDDADGVLRQDSFRSASSSSSGSAVKVPTGNESMLPRVTTGTRESWSVAAPRQDDLDTRTNEDVHPIAQRIAPKHDPPSLTLRMFHTFETTASLAALGSTYYDGSICVSIALYLTPPPPRIIVAQGVYFAENGNRDEVWDREIHVVDAKLPLEAAIVALRKLVDTQERVGFRLVPEQPQRDAIARVLGEIRDATCPRYAAALHRPKKTPYTTSNDEKHTSLDRASTRVRHRSSTDSLTRLGDVQLQHALTLKKRDANARQERTTRGDHALLVEAAGLHAAASPRPRGRRRDCELRSREREPPYEWLAATLGLDHASQDAWITVLNEPSPPTKPTLRASQSLPVLIRRPPLLAGHTRTKGC